MHVTHAQLNTGGHRPCSNMAQINCQWYNYITTTTAGALISATVQSIRVTRLFGAVRARNGGADIWSRRAAASLRP